MHAARSLWWLSYLFTFSLVLASCSKASAAGIADIQARGVLRFGVSGDYHPFSVCSEDMTHCEGFDVEVARQIAIDLGVQVSFVRFRWPELLADLTSAKFDIAMSGITIRPERVLRATFTRPYAMAAAVVLVADGKKFSTLADVNHEKVRVAVNAGGHLEQVARTHLTAATILPTPKNQSLPDIVMQQQADALVTDSLEAPHFQAKHPTLHALPAFGRDRKAYMLRREDSDVREWLDQWLTTRESDEFLGKLRAHWLGKEPTITPHEWAALLALIDVRLAVMPAIADFKRRNNLPIEDTQQEQAVLTHVAAQARTLGLNEENVQRVFRIQIELAKQVQQAALQRVTEKNGIPSWAQGLDLSRDLRPALGELNDRIVHELARVSQVVHNQIKLQRLVNEEITVSGVSLEGKRQLADALSAISEKRGGNGEKGKRRDKRRMGDWANGRLGD
jgi:cyclohexadienyl dehydratase